MTEKLLTEIRDLLLLLVKAEAENKGLEWQTEEEFVSERLKFVPPKDRPDLPSGFEDQLRERYRRDGGYRRSSHHARAR